MVGHLKNDWANQWRCISRCLDRQLWPYDSILMSCVLYLGCIDVTGAPQYMTLNMNSDRLRQCHSQRFMHSVFAIQQHHHSSAKARRLSSGTYVNSCSPFLTLQKRWLEPTHLYLRNVSCSSLVSIRDHNSIYCQTLLMFTERKRF